MCMFKQRKPNDICKKIDNASTDPWQNDPKSPDNTGSFACTAEKSLQLFCKDSKQYCSMQRLPEQYVYATECADQCKVFREKNEHKQCLYYIFNEAERVCTLMIACEQQYKISICEDTSAKNYTSGKCHQTGNDCKMQYRFITYLLEPKCIYFQIPIPPYLTWKMIWMSVKG